MGGPTEQVTRSDDDETWNVQLFRSIDAGSAAGFPDHPREVAAAGLVSGKDNTIDRSIQDAYIHAIRRAKHFIYIENQYFLGSSFGWLSDQEADVSHLIPAELVQKIVSKIEAGERFAVYVVVPMWPEGVPESASVQAILDWMRKTMEMMYTRIAEALRAKRIRDESPRDYLTFFCLGNREVVKGDDEYEPSESPEDGTDYKSAQDNRRFMIYVHAKMMIVDDEYIIVGSANINQRSMDGTRDSEIALGAYQPHRLATQGLPRGAIHGFRTSLWYEHLHELDEVFLDPSSLQCVRKVNEVGDRLLELYTGVEVVDLPGHLLSFPVKVAKDGAVTEWPGIEHYPDTKALVKGEKSSVLPSILTS